MTERFRVLVADAIAAEGLTPLRGDARFEVLEQPGLGPAELAVALRDADALLVRSTTRVTRQSLAQAQRLKVIGRAGVGVDTIDVDAATERGIAVLTAPSGNTIAAAELTLALLLSLVRRVPAADRSMRSGEWDRKSFTGVELQGKTLGLVGAGRIGGEVARRARAFAMKIIAYDPYLSAEVAQRLEIELRPLDDVLALADVVSVHVPLTDATAGLIGEQQLARLKPSALLVNAARGGIVDEAALVSALRERRLAGAALDVYAEEPLPADHPLRTLDNVVLTPHLGASTAEAQQNVAIEIAEAVRAALVDGDLSRAVNVPALAGEEMRKARPLFDLAERLGSLAFALSDGPLQAVEVRYAGAADRVLRPLAASVLIGVLGEVVGRHAVNFVNAVHLAKTRGIEVRQVQLGPYRAYAEHVQVQLTTPERQICVAGALLAEEHPRVVQIGDFHVDVVPRGTLVVLRNRDVPGVIGRVGTLLGDAGINIGEYHQARLAAGGQALAAISVDDRLSENLIDALRRLPEVIDVRQAYLDGERSSRR